MQCVILAGGLGTRMWPETRLVPKTLLPVGDHPFAHWQLSWLAASGVTSVVYCIGHLGAAVASYVGNGRAWGLDVRYSDEGATRLGTAGAVRHACATVGLDDSFLVLYGDSWLQIDPGDVLRHAGTRPERALMTVYANGDRWDASNVVFDGTRVRRYAKGLAVPPPEMTWIDYGLSVLDRDLVLDHVPDRGEADLSDLWTTLADQDDLAGYVATERFYEIGSPSGRAELDALLTVIPA